MGVVVQVLVGSNNYPMGVGSYSAGVRPARVPPRLPRTHGGPPAHLAESTKRGLMAGRGAKLPFTIRKKPAAFCLRANRGARGASRPQGTKKASEVRGRRVRTAVRESAPQVLGTEDKKLSRQESPTTRDRTNLTKRTCCFRPLQCCPGANCPSPKEFFFSRCHSEPPFSPPQH